MRHGDHDLVIYLFLYVYIFFFIIISNYGLLVGGCRYIWYSQLSLYTIPFPSKYSGFLCIKLYYNFLFVTKCETSPYLHHINEETQGPVSFAGRISLSPLPFARESSRLPSSANLVDTLQSVRHMTTSYRFARSSNKLSYI